MSNSLQPHELQHPRPPCPSLCPRVCSNSCPFNQWCHPTTLSSVAPFSTCLHSFPASGSFPMSQPFASGGQSIGVWASALVLPVNLQGWFPLWLTGLISLQSKGLSGVFSSTTFRNHHIYVCVCTHIYIKELIYLFGKVFAIHGLSLVAAGWSFSLLWLLLLQSMGFRALWLLFLD